MKKVVLSTLILASSLLFLNSCEKEPVAPVSTSEEVDTTDRKYVPHSCPLFAQNSTSYGGLGSVLFGVVGFNTEGTIDDHLNCPTDYFDRCNTVSVSGVSVTGYTDDPLNVNGYLHPLSDGVMSVAEQMSLVALIKSRCRNYLDTYHSTGHIVTDYDVSYISPLCCNEMIIYVDFTASTVCR
jgi:hypothetical protein